MKSPMHTEKFTVTIEVPFWEYPNKSLNRKAIVQIKRFIKAVLEDELCAIPLRVEKDKLGNVYEDATLDPTIRVK